MLALMIKGFGGIPVCRLHQSKWVGTGVCVCVCLFTHVNLLPIKGKQVKEIIGHTHKPMYTHTHAHTYVMLDFVSNVFNSTIVLRSF